MWKLCVILILFVASSDGQSSVCPLPWRLFRQECYFFHVSDVLDYPSAVEHCNLYGAAVVSVNTLEEHNFLVQQLRIFNTAGYEWYTSGIAGQVLQRVEWDGDGTLSTLETEWWFSEEDRALPYHRIVYKTNGYEYGWSKVQSHNTLPFICEIPQVEAYRISQDRRDFTYGTNLTDASKAPKGPSFILQPVNLVVVEEDSRSSEIGVPFTVSLECLADGNPMPTYRIVHKFINGSTVDVSNELDKRYTVTGGRLVILNPTETQDAGIYQCIATNIYGQIYSEVANITFGVLDQFSNVQRAPVVAEEFQSAVVECSPPQYKPAVTYQWYRGQVADFVRPDLNPYIFISSNGKLYFSEITKNDEGDYNCIVKLTSGGEGILSTVQPPSRISTRIPLQVRHQVPATWGPQIADGFIASFPTKPLRGKNVKLECLAYGTLPLIYSWSRKNYPLPESTVLSDHNRILQIFNVQLEDAGTYYCTVSRNNGARAQAVHHLVVETKPYFVFPLPDQHADSGSQITMRCVAKAIPLGIYLWYKNGVLLSSKPGDTEVYRNVITIKNVDAEKHGGMYQCVAQNTHGSSYSTAQLRVLAFRPTFVKHPLNPSQTAAVGSQTEIECSPEAAPKPEYTWKRNGANLNPIPDDGASRVRLLANGNLFISEVQSNDAGRYCCMATNEYGSDESCGQLNVVTRTVLSVPPSNSVGRVNRTSVLLCEASFPGDVDSLYIWRFNDKVINFKNNPHFTLGSSRYQGALYIRSARFEHTGIYTCTAKTTYDAVNASAMLTIEGPPGPPAGVRVETASITSTSAMVIWIEGETHGRPVEYHIIEASNEFNDTWTPLNTYVPYSQSNQPGTDRHAFLVENIKPGNGYFFRVRGVNAFGMGEASRSSVVYRIPGSPPTKYPDHVGGGGGSVGILTINWDHGDIPDSQGKTFVIVNPWAENKTLIPLLKFHLTLYYMGYVTLHEEDQGAPGIGYHVYWRKANTSGKFSEAAVMENVGHYATTIGKENYYLLYEVKVAAFNSLGVGPTSPDGVFIYSAEEMPIGIATNIYAWAYNATAVEVTWVPVPNDREHIRGTLLGYQVNYQLRFVEGASLDAVSWRGETTSGIVIGLDPFTWYKVDVQLLTMAGMGPRAEYFYVKTYKQAPILYPTEIHVYSHSSTSVVITWRGVSTSSNEENLLGYKIRYWPSTDDVRTATDVLTERLQTEAIVYGIQKDIVYECRVFGYSRGGDGKHSVSVYFTLGGLVAFDPSSSEILASADFIHSSATNNIILSVIVTTLTILVFK